MEKTMHERMYKKYIDSVSGTAVFMGTSILPSLKCMPKWSLHNKLPPVFDGRIPEMIVKGGIPLVKGDHRLEPRKEFYCGIERVDLTLRRTEYYVKFGVPVGEYSRSQYNEFGIIDIIKLLNENIPPNNVSVKLSTVPAGKEDAPYKVALRKLVVGIPDQVAMKVYHNKLMKLIAGLNRMDYSLPEPFSDGEVLHSEWKEPPVFKRKCLNCGHIMELTEHTPLSSTTKHLFTSYMAPYCPRCHSFKVRYIFNEPKVKEAQHTENMAWESGKLMVQNIDMHLRCVSKTPSIKVDSNGCVISAKVKREYEVIYDCGERSCNWGFWDDAVGNPMEGDWEVFVGCCHACDEGYINSWAEWHYSNMIQGNLPEAARALEMNHHTPIDMDNLPPQNPVCWALKDWQRRLSAYNRDYVSTKRKAARINQLIADQIICGGCERVLTTDLSRKVGLCSNCRNSDDPLTYWIDAMFPLGKPFRALDMVDDLTVIQIPTRPKWCPPAWDQQLQTYVGACYGQNEFKQIKKEQKRWLGAFSVLNIKDNPYGEPYRVVYRPENSYGAKHWKGIKSPTYPTLDIPMSETSWHREYTPVKDLLVYGVTDWKLVPITHPNYYPEHNRCIVCDGWRTGKCDQKPISRALPKVEYEWEPIQWGPPRRVMIHKRSPDFTSESEIKFHNDILKKMSLEKLEGQPVRRQAVADDRMIFNGCTYKPVGGLKERTFVYGTHYRSNHDGPNQAHVKKGHTQTFSKIEYTGVPSIDTPPFDNYHVNLLTLEYLLTKMVRSPMAVLMNEILKLRGEEVESHDTMVRKYSIAELTHMAAKIAIKLGIKKNKIPKVTKAFNGVPARGDKYYTRHESLIKNLKSHGIYDDWCRKHGSGSPLFVEFAEFADDWSALSPMKIYAEEKEYKRHIKKTSLDTPIIPKPEVTEIDEDNYKFERYVGIFKEGRSEFEVVAIDANINPEPTDSEWKLPSITMVNDAHAPYVSGDQRTYPKEIPRTEFEKKHGIYKKKIKNSPAIHRANRAVKSIAATASKNKDMLLPEGIDSNYNVNVLMKLCKKKYLEAGMIMMLEAGVCDEPDDTPRKIEIIETLAFTHTSYNTMKNYATRIRKHETKS